MRYANGQYKPDTLEDAAKRAKRRNKNIAKRAPLFAHAGLIEQVTAEQMIAEEQTFLDDFEQHRALEQNRADYLRLRVAEIVNEATLAMLDRQRKIYPPSPEYALSHWFAQLVKYAPAVAQTECPHIKDNYGNLVDEKHNGHLQFARHGDAECPMCKKNLKEDAR